MEEAITRIYIGLDGGGTHTRTLAVDATGRILATAKSGGSSPYHNKEAKRNSHEAITAVVENADATLADVAGLVAGFAGLDEPNDSVWAEEQTAVPGISCPRSHVNDAVIAHAGALRSQPGIIAIGGTGSIVFGVTESGRQLRNYDFRHYASCAARLLSYAAIYRMVVGDTQDSDRDLITQTLEFWEVVDMNALRELAAKGFISDGDERTHRLGEMSPLVTTAALSGSPLAQAVCNDGAKEMAIGIRLLGSCFAEERIPVALIGGAVRSEFVQSAVQKALSGDPLRRFEVVDPAFPPVIGAAMMALEQGGIALEPAVLNSLRTSQMRFLES